MSEPQLSAEEIAHWKAFALKFLRAQNKLDAQRKAVQESLAGARELASRHVPQGLIGRYLNFEIQLLESIVANLEMLPLNNQVYEPFLAMHSPEYEVRSMEQVYLRVCMDALLYEEMAAWLSDDSQKLPAEVQRPAIFQEVEPSWRSSTELRERLLAANAALGERLRQLDAPMNEVRQISDPTLRLERLKSLNIAALNGLAYRVDTALRLLPSGELVRDSFRQQLFQTARQAPSQRTVKSLTKKIRAALGTDR